MFALDHRTTYIFQAIAVNINFIKQLTDELASYAAPDWNGKAITFIQRLQVCVTRFEVQCQTWYWDIPDDPPTEIIRFFVHDIHSPLAVIQGYCSLIKMSVPTHDAARIMLEAIQSYTFDIGNIISELCH